MGSLWKCLCAPADGSSVATHASRESCDRQAAYQKPPSGRESCERVSYPAGQKIPAGLHHAPFIFPEGLSSIETLLTNIQVRLCRGFIIIIRLGDEWEGRWSHSLGFPEMVNSRRGRHSAVIGVGVCWPASQIWLFFVAGGKDVLSVCVCFFVLLPYLTWSCVLNHTF